VVACVGSGQGGASGLGRSVLEVEGDPSELMCCGAVSVRSGGSLKFCTLPIGTCTVQAHQAGRTRGAKHVLYGSALYIQTSDKTALVSPHLDRSALSESELIEITMQVLSVEQWIQLFGIIQGQAEARKQPDDAAFMKNGAFDNEIEPKHFEDVKQVTARVERAGDFQTPLKPVQLERIEAVKVELTRFDELGETEVAFDQEVWQALLGGNWNKLVGAVSSLEAALPVMRGQCTDMLHGLASVVEGVEDKANALGLAIGQRGPTLEAEGSVWDAIARSLAMVTSLGEVIGSVASDLVTVDKTVTQVDTALKAHVAEVHQVVGKIHGSHHRVKTRLTQLEERDVSKALPGLSPCFVDEIPAAVAYELDRFRDEYNELRGEIELAQANVGVSTGAGGALTPTEFHERLQKVEMRATGESYIADQRVFASYEDVLNWVQGAAGRTEIHLYWDVFSLLSKTRDDSFSTHEYLEGALMSERLKQNPLTSLVMSSLLIQMPGPFLLKRTTGSGSNAATPLPTIKTFDEWNTVQTGFNHQLQRAVTTEVAGLRRMMLTAISRQDFELSGLTVHMLTQAQIQWASMATWITDFYYRLVGEGGLTAKESWLIVGNSVQAIFSLIHRTRAAGHDAIVSSGDKSVKAAHFLWAAMQTHRLFSEVHLRNWDAHHCVQAVLSMHVVRNRITPSAFEQLGNKLDALTRLLDKLDGRVSTLEKKKQGN
jgi:uncharacterized protein YozE (UPF0346 family)